VDFGSVVGSLTLFIGPRNTFYRGRVVRKSYSYSPAPVAWAKAGSRK